MGSLTEHLRRPDDHGRLAFHPDCPLCCEERLAGPLPHRCSRGASDSGRCRCRRPRPVLGDADGGARDGARRGARGSDDSGAGRPRGDSERSGIRSGRRDRPAVRRWRRTGSDAARAGRRHGCPARRPPDEAGPVEQEPLSTLRPPSRSRRRNRHPKSRPENRLRQARIQSRRPRQQTTRRARACARSGAAAVRRPGRRDTADSSAANRDRDHPCGSRKEARSRASQTATSARHHAVVRVRARSPATA